MKDWDIRTRDMSNLLLSVSLILTLNFVKDVCMVRHIDISLEPESEQRSQVKLFMLIFVVPSAIHSRSTDTLFCSRTIRVVFVLCSL